jgi:hypothetical protein
LPQEHALLAVHGFIYPEWQLDGDPRSSYDEAMAGYVMSEATVADEHWIAFMPQLSRRRQNHQANPRADASDAFRELIG